MNSNMSYKNRDTTLGSFDGHHKVYGMGWDGQHKTLRFPSGHARFPCTVYFCIYTCSSTVNAWTCIFIWLNINRMLFYSCMMLSRVDVWRTSFWVSWACDKQHWLYHLVCAHHIQRFRMYANFFECGPTHYDCSPPVFVMWRKTNECKHKLLHALRRIPRGRQWASQRGGWCTTLQHGIAMTLVILFAVNAAHDFFFVVL